MYEAAAFDIKTPEKGAFGHVTKSGDPDMTRQGPGGTSASNRRPILRAASTQGNAASSTCPATAEPYENFRDALNRLQDGREHCFAG
jgi:hypothetical protein